MPFNPITSPVDYILLANQRSPGLAEVEGAASLREWVERNGYGVTGGFSVFKRRKLAHFSVKLRLYTADDWTAWHAWKPLVNKLPTRRGGNAPASGNLKIDHPILADLDITAAGVEKVSQPVQTADGEWTITIDFIEFRAPAVTLAKPEGAKATPVDPYDQKIMELEEQFNDLARK
jgi:hypothetical protein